MTPAEFKKKWARYRGKETSAYQEHFNDICYLLGQKTPAEADPSGSDWFCFQKRVVKDLEFFAIDDNGAELADNDRGFADVWRQDRFAWEYKGKRKNLDEAYRQLLRYRESLLNPPLLVVCDFDRFIIRTNFNGTVQETHEFTNDQIDRPESLHLLRALFENPDLLKPQRTTAQVTEQMARQIAELARLIQERESIELADATTRKEVRVAQKKNLRIARFLNRIVFCFFAEDTGLLPSKLFSEILNTSINDPKHFTEAVEQLFRIMSDGGLYGHHKIRHFNGHLFEDSTVFELTEDEIKKLAEAAEADWQFIQPSIMGNLFERGLDPDQRAQLGAHYTSEVDIRALVEPVLMAPLRRDWAQVKGELSSAVRSGKGKPADRECLAGFLKKLSTITVFDPACGSGNFLYVSLHLLLNLEKEVITFGTLLGFRFEPEVSVQQLRAIELNSYAFELAQVSAQIGFLQWRRDNGFDNDRSPVLQNLDGFQNEDALLVPHFHSKAKTLKEAQAGEHKTDDALKFYTERRWPKCDVIVSNPPFLGGKLLRRELGDDYVAAMFSVYEKRVEPQADLCCYWFEKARELVANKQCKRAGLLATQGIRGGANREALKRIKESGDIFFAVSDREWVLAGADVHVSMIGFDDGTEKSRTLDGISKDHIPTNLSLVADTTEAATLAANLRIAFMGDTKGGKFDISEEAALEMLRAPNPHGRPNSDVILPWVNGQGLSKRIKPKFIVDFGVILDEVECAKYELPFDYVSHEVKPKRLQNKRPLYAKFWWRHVEARPGMIAALEPLPRFLGTVRHTKHRIFFWLEAPTKPDSAMFVFASAADAFFGLVHSRIHEVWARQQATQVRERESGLRYTPSSCFETFPFPFPLEAPLPQRESVQQSQAEAPGHYFIAAEDPAPYGSSAHRAAIGAAAKELNELRERWLNPPEWTETRTLEFPGSITGPWARYVDQPSIDVKVGVGIVRYPRLEPRDAECAAKLKKRTLTNLYNDRPAWLDFAHKKLDAAVAAAYGWPIDLSDEEILTRLLALNVTRVKEEAKAVVAEARNTGPKKPQRQKRDDEII